MLTLNFWKWTVYVVLTLALTASAYWLGYLRGYLQQDWDKIPIHMVDPNDLTGRPTVPDEHKP